MNTIISIKDLTKVYDSGFNALKSINLDINKGEILGLLGPNGAGKTTLISTICGIVSPTSGEVTVDGFDIVKDFRKTRSIIGLVPQELTLGSFDTVWGTVRFSRGLFGAKRDDAYLEELLKDLSLFDKKDSEIRMLSGGMKRRVLIAKALSHNPKILFLDEPTAGVDVELRKDLWKIVNVLKSKGVTIILTTHYIEEAEEMCDRIGILNKGNLIALDSTKNLLERIQTKRVTFKTDKQFNFTGNILESLNIISNKQNEVCISYEKNKVNIDQIINLIKNDGVKIKDIKTDDGDLEDVFLNLIKN